ncbi:aspartate 1-decarboxylase [Wenzhouxiangella marina]|uniref:Aspartate 1-decarboxylase n=1 Tax=Wenzhouxiangella marina TaxID=1579979 RepID=A0A0K0XTE4_9GAMM|nr:aspartate 1-decarboxylase [Wenzhouxiangella marina]AKS40958.1 aspartate decarboxylase [Wenzhouxiangella marina]MBB6087832.1 aspartate 1-decarboxylase [Wenzhouxiangella marina]
MQIQLLKAKIHRATVTQVELDYEGSCAIDEDLLEAAGIREYEQIHIYNITSGERFVTYAIRAERGTGVISVNGAAAHKASVGDLVIIAAYAGLDAAEAERHVPSLVYPDADNRIMRTAGSIPVQAA